jgi:hypothetical protein
MKKWRTVKRGAPLVPEEFNTACEVDVSGRFIVNIALPVVRAISKNERSGLCLDAFAAKTIPPGEIKFPWTTKLVPTLDYAIPAGAAKSLSHGIKVKCFFEESWEVVTSMRKCGPMGVRQIGMSKFFTLLYCTLYY